jgi:hypothetical protein
MPYGEWSLPRRNPAAGRNGIVTIGNGLCTGDGESSGAVVGGPAGGEFRSGSGSPFGPGRRPLAANAAGAPLSQTGYDENLGGLGIITFNNKKLLGSPTSHTTGFNNVPYELTRRRATVVRRCWTRSTPQPGTTMATRCGAFGGSVPDLWTDWELRALYELDSADIENRSAVDDDGKGIYWPRTVLGYELRKPVERFSKAAHVGSGMTWSGSARDGRKLDASRCMIWPLTSPRRRPASPARTGPGPSTSRSHSRTPVLSSCSGRPVRRWPGKCGRRDDLLGRATPAFLRRRVPERLRTGRRIATVSFV